MTKVCRCVERLRALSMRFKTPNISKKTFVSWGAWSHFLMKKQKSRVKELARQENSILKHQIPISFRQPPCVSFVSCSRLFDPLSVSSSSLSLSPDGLDQRHELDSYDDDTGGHRRGACGHLLDVLTSEDSALFEECMYQLADDRRLAVWQLRRSGKDSWVWEDCDRERGRIIE